ncbi:tRNA (N6-threonylcarbamoyladenosine(37)-N6)-methyltransferase TrmO [Desulforhopalus sp. IMCC35007]|nr:tRNA (N6-threonylcarbamoyladenosine(37)-N6)-methyltransferase TrmO [Desulforhopalus sp. IMCC35007]
MHIHPVGTVSSPIKDLSLKAGESGLERQENDGEIRENHQRIKETVCDLVIAKEWQELLDGIEEFSHALVLYWPHLLDTDRRRIKKVHPMGRKDLPLTGIFATRSPARPNPILVSVVKIVEREKNILRVVGLEAVDGSPVLDIKPHVKSYDTLENPKLAPWMEQIQRELEGEDVK